MCLKCRRVCLTQLTGRLLSAAVWCGLSLCPVTDLFRPVLWGEFHSPVRDLWNREIEADLPAVSSQAVQHHTARGAFIFPVHLPAHIPESSTDTVWYRLNLCMDLSSRNLLLRPAKSNKLVKSNHFSLIVFWHLN